MRIEKQSIEQSKNHQGLAHLQEIQYDSTMIKTLFVAGLFFGTLNSSFAMDCADLSGRYLLQEYELMVIQKDCKKVVIAEEVGSDTLIVDGIEHRETDYHNSILISKIDWSANRQELVISKQVIILDRPLFTSTETYSLLPNGDLQLKMLDQFENGSPQARTVVFQRIQ